MMIWDVVFDEPRARNTDPETSHEAARSVLNRLRVRDMVLTVLRSHGPQTHEQIIKNVKDLELALNPGPAMVSDSGIRTRVSELVDSGDVEESGMFGKTRAGRRAILWQVSKGSNGSH